MNEVKGIFSYINECPCGVEQILNENLKLGKSATDMKHTCICGRSIWINIMTSVLINRTEKPGPELIEDGYYKVCLTVQGGMSWRTKLHRKSGVWSSENISGVIREEDVTIISIVKVSPVTQGVPPQNT